MANSPNPNDGTVLNPGTGGDTISNEDQPSGESRQGSPLNASLPVTDYKVSRSKIAVGDYDADAGDAMPANALPVRDLFGQALLEDAFIVQQDSYMAEAKGRHGMERLNLINNRGNHSRGSSR